MGLLVIGMENMKINESKDSNINLRFKEWKPLTIGLWRPYQVEVGFIEDYIKRSGYENDKIILY